MKFARGILFAVVLCSTSLEAAETQFVPELLKYNLRTTVEAYDKVGHKDPKWNDQAKACLKAFAEMRSTTNWLPERMISDLRSNLAAIIALKCDDPMVRYLHTRYVFGQTHSAAELVPVYTEVASALEQADYPAIRSFYARLWVYRMTTDAGVEKNTGALLEKAAGRLGLALEDKTMPGHEAAAACEELMIIPWWSDPERWSCYRSLQTVLDENWNNTSFAQLAKGRGFLTHAWEARGTGYANTVSDQGWRLLGQRLDVAATALEKAWELDPNDPSICLEMERVELGQHKGRQRLETWFERGMKLNPASWNICYAKLEYLRPRWYGSVPQMIQFGWQCMTNPDWSYDVRLGLANAHYEAAREMHDSQSMNAYLAQTNVWSDIRTNFEYFFKLYPKEAGYRHNFAKFASYAGDWDEFLRQVKLFPSTNYAYFGGAARFNQLLATGRMHAHGDSTLEVDANKKK